MVESVRWRRLRWRLRGAWQWPAFAVLTVVDAVLVARLPFQGEGADAIGAVLVAGFFNLLAVALLAPLLRDGCCAAAGRDLPFLIARDYAGTALLVLIFAGAARRRADPPLGPCVAERADQRGGVRRPCTTTWSASEPAFAPASASWTRCGSSPTATAPASTGRRALPICLFVNTDQSPPGLDPRHRAPAEPKLTVPGTLSVRGQLERLLEVLADPARNSAASAP